MHKKFYSKEEIDFLKENLDKFGVYICSQKLNRHLTAVISKCHREFGYCNYICKATQDEINGLQFISNFKPLEIDFSLTDCPKELSYFLGYFWADGYISSNQDLFMEIVKDDADDIEHIFMKVCSFHRYERNRVNRKAQKTFHYTDYERNITSLLTKLGKYPKTIESHENIMKYIPKQYLNYFIRGLFDGDGSLYVHNNKVQITISGRYEQDWSYLVNFLNKEYNINFKINLRTYKSFKSSHIRNVNPKSIINFLKQIYDVDDGIYLNRKYNKIKQLICKQ